MRKRRVERMVFAMLALARLHQLPDLSGIFPEPLAVRGMVMAMFATRLCRFADEHRPKKRDESHQRDGTKYNKKIEPPR